jgi:hypothetical protein
MQISSPIEGWNLANEIVNREVNLNRESLVY